MKDLGTDAPHGSSLRRGDGLSTFGAESMVLFEQSRPSPRAGPFSEMVKNPIWLSAQPACVAGGGADGMAKSDFPFWKGVAPGGRACGDKERFSTRHI